MLEAGERRPLDGRVALVPNLIDARELAGDTDDVGSRELITVLTILEDTIPDCRLRFFE